MERVDTILVRVRCGWRKRTNQARVKTELYANVLVSMTLEGYKFFSLSLSVMDVVPSFGPCPAATFETLGRDEMDTDGDSVLGTPDTEAGEPGTLR